jgi:TolA-binding protein
MAESYRSLGQMEKACDSYKKVIEDGEGSFVEISMLNFSKISYDLENWKDALGGYASLFESAVLENNKYTALVGMMRSAYKGHEWSEAVKNADRVIFDSRSDVQMKQEADYIKAKSYLATSRRDEALNILEKLSVDMKSAYGAEAAYMLINDSYDKGDFEAVEKKVYAFSDAGSGQTYWLAKSFIILGDSFVESGELKQAKATFESVRDGYEPSSENDDVQDNVQMRLKKLDELIAEQNQ